MEIFFINLKKLLLTEKDIIKHIFMFDELFFEFPADELFFEFLKMNSYTTFDY